ncbi:MAG: hypothetical protein M0Q42_06145 [Xanthomonadales bacterium]|nr:hypothetical protein [Xanthomonadales bacterium]
MTRRQSHSPAIIFLAGLALLLASASALAATRHYEVDYTAAFDPEAGQAVVTMAVRNGDGRATRFDLAMPGKRYHDIDGDGQIERDGDRVLWTLPRAGGELSWRYDIDRRRRDGGYDARITADWLIARGDHLFPSARAGMTAGSQSRTRLRLVLPEGWSNAESQWPAGEDGWFIVDNPETRFDRPTGWLIAGDVGTRREQYDNIEVVVAAPKGDNMPRQQILAMIGWTLPEMERIFGQVPPKLLIVGAGDPMWRGGLSGPRSLYMHSDRPLISENGTSTLLHELVHVFSRISGGPGHQYISEGIAEFYSIELLHRTGGTTQARYERTRAQLERWSRNVRRLTVDRSHGPVTARAVLLFMDLDKEIRQASDQAHSLDDVTRLLMAKRRVDTDDLREAAEQVLGRPSRTLDTPLLR